jgi:hypothetical protein
MNRHDEANSFSRRDFFRLGGAGLAGAALLGTATPAHAAGLHSSNESSSGSGGLRITRQKWVVWQISPSISIHSLTGVT